ncbi:hypothetical protein F5Y18DRAFT_417535 [Xylariaceae sp. FL1019]|nr:hypothetical protein F5Y18DRAFT_417535 [Xylariaceae sp. FL1019]
MHWQSLLTAAAAAAPVVNAAGATLRFSCSQLVVERLDPIVNPGVIPSPHLHQVVGGNTFNASMDPTVQPSLTATCTSCTPTEDFSNYWTAVCDARNGTLHRVNTFGNELGFTQASGGQTVYYLSSGKVTAFRAGFRMTVGDPSFRTAAQLNAKYKYIDFTCLQSSMTRGGATTSFPSKPCPESAGIMASIRFPTCWNGQDLDSPDHQSHVAYPSGTTCPATHPVAVPQVFYETYWDTRPFNNQADWPTDGSQPFVWSFGDETGYGFHADYVFGWKGDALQRAMDANCNSDLFANQINCNTLKTQSLADANKCTVSRTVDENLDGWMTQLPGGMAIV